MSVLEWPGLYSAGALSLQSHCAAAFVSEVSQGEFQSVYFALPSFLLGSFPSYDQIRFEFVQPEDHPRFHVQRGAADAGVFVCARGAVGPAAGTEFDLAFVEVFL
ncbi:hypothetical protein QFZ40_001616 [Arthrobacter pascens]|uniref:hypothetical protein n=1 Tax=Arthrobacter pascens TaxID=1677 RepID=UPI002783DD04|nr:hypothetical protein [Arthrobacter pascens]MDQ0633707.1 hypothetical protein [Arthrobacter pascens]